MLTRVSVAMIALDHASTIGRALESVSSIADEIVLVDLGSRDSTRDIASQYGAIVHDVAWHDDFSAARNESFAHCTGDWIMWLAADDVVPGSALTSFHDFKGAHLGTLDGVDVVVAPYHWHHENNGSPSIVFHRERLVRRTAGLTWDGAVFERITIPPNRFGLTSDLVVDHRPDPIREERDADQAFTLLERSVQEGDRSPRTLFNYANLLYDHGRYGEAIQNYRTYLDVDPDGADRYWANVFLGESLIVVEEEDEAARCALAAIAEDSSRAEGYMLFGRLRFATEDWAEAAPLFIAATGATRPTIGLLRESDYTWAPWDFLAVCYEKLGNLPGALAAAQQSLRGNPEADRVRANLHLIVDRLVAGRPTARR